MYLNVGSSHTINCTVASPQPPDRIFWYFNHRPLPVTSHGHPGHEEDTGDWAVTSLMAPDMSWSQVTLSVVTPVSIMHPQVVLASVQVEHSGLYECRPSNCDSDTVSLVILDGETQTSVILIFRTGKIKCNGQMGFLALIWQQASILIAKR